MIQSIPSVEVREVEAVSIDCCLVQVSALYAVPLLIKPFPLRCRQLAHRFEAAAIVRHSQFPHRALVGHPCTAARDAQSLADLLKGHYAVAMRVVCLVRHSSPLPCPRRGIGGLSRARLQPGTNKPYPARFSWVVVVCPTSYFSRTIGPRPRISGSAAIR
jgi:hypothetical protein